jgi:hypothetical protein
MSTLALAAPPADLHQLHLLTEMLECRLERQVHNLRLEVVPGGLALYGQAPCYYVRRWAEEEAEALTGLPVLGNNIDVQ